MPQTAAANKRKANRNQKEASAELGEGDFAISYNARTGRPVRRGAGRKSTDSPFVDSTAFVSDPESDFEETLGLGKTTRKRKRSPSPPLSEHSEGEDDTVASEANYSDAIATRQITPNTNIAPISLTFNIPPGHNGPFVVNLDIASLLNSPLQLGRLIPGGSRASQKSASRLSTPVRPTKTRKKHSKSATSTVAGFLDLPAELRNKIYRIVFVAHDWLNFGAPRNFKRSSALLRTCKQVYDEGRGILYPENEFFFHRFPNSRGSYWETSWTEVGFKSVRKFLKMIGPTNTALIRHVTILFEDAVPSLNTHLKDAEERRFVHDDNVMSILRHLADYGNLQKLEMCFQGRKPLRKTDQRFLDHLKRVKADKVEIVAHQLLRGSWYAKPSNSSSNVETAMVQAMTRTDKVHGELPKRKNKLNI